jgi:hypothetical protein
MQEHELLGHFGRPDFGSSRGLRATATNLSSELRSCGTPYRWLRTYMDASQFITYSIVLHTGGILYKMHM